jgi:hypothetical protein
MPKNIAICVLAALVALVVLVPAIPALRRRFWRRLKFDYLGDYFKSFYANFVDIAFGVPVVGVVWAMRWSR